MTYLSDDDGDYVYMELPCEVKDGRVCVPAFVLPAADTEPEIDFETAD